MRLPFPERISLFHAAMFAALLCFAQIVEGTPPAFSLCCFLFIIVATIAFNFAGGFTRPSGSYIFFYAVLGVIVGLVWKAVLGEPADSNLETPQLTIEVFLGGICSMLVASYLARKLTAKRALLGTMLDDSRMRNATIGCVIAGIATDCLFAFVPHSSGSFLSALQQVDRFLPMAIIIGVTYQIRKSGGTSSINLPVLLAIAFSFVSGVFEFTKEGMLTPLLCWLVAACCMRYKVSMMQVVGGILAVLFIFEFLVPYSQYGRDYKSTSFSQQYDSVVYLLSNLDYVRTQYAEEQAEIGRSSGTIYYNTPQGFFDRLQMISFDDTLISFTQQRGAIGLFPLASYFENLVPHVFWPNKPIPISGNTYARAMGTLPQDDTTTGISFSPTGEAFHLARWLGVFIVAPILWMVLFIIFDSLCGDVRKSPWGLLVSILFSHEAPEGLLGAVVYMYSYTTIMIVVVALSVSYIMPLIGSLAAGPEGISIRRTKPVRSIARRAVD